MAKLTLDDLSSLTNEQSAIALINNNNADIETALENTLSRDGTAPNMMGADLDMDSNHILNLPEPTTAQEPVTVNYLDTHTASFTGLATTSTDNAIVRFDGVLGHTQNSIPTISDLGTLSIAPTTGINKGLSIAQTASGTPTQENNNLFLATGWDFNHIYAMDTGVNSSGYAAGSQNVNAFRVAYASSGGAYGPGQAIFGTVNIYGSPALSSNTFNQYIAGQFIGQTSASLGGTNTGAGAVGAIFGFGGGALAAIGSTNLLNVSGCEINSAIQTGASSKSFSNLSIATHNTHAVSGSTYDASISISALSGALGVNNGILFSDYNGAHGIKTTGTLIATQGSATVGSGIDFSSHTITDNFLKGPGGFSVTGAGQVLCSNGTITTSKPMTITQTWNDAAVTFTAHKVNITSTAAQAGSFIFDYSVGGAQVFAGFKSGVVFTAATGGYFFNSRGGFTSGGDGFLLWTNNAISDFTQVSLGPATASFPAFRHSGTTLRIVLGDNSAAAPVEMGTPKFSGTNTTGSGSAALGANSPATTNTAPYTWIQITTSDGSTAYIPAWK